jgi:hypothetical protein
MESLLYSVKLANHDPSFSISKPLAFEGEGNWLATYLHDYIN